MRGVSDNKKTQRMGDFIAQQAAMAMILSFYNQAGCVAIEGGIGVEN